MLRKSWSYQLNVMMNIPLDLRMSMLEDMTISHSDGGQHSTMTTG